MTQSTDKTTGNFSSSATRPEQNALGSIAGSFQETAKAAGKTAAELAGNVVETVEEWGAAAGNVAVQASKKAGEVASMAADTAGEVGSNFVGLVRRYPIPSILVGIGLGLLVGKLTQSRR